MKKDHNQLNWLMVSLIAFNMVWGLGNVVNNYSTQGISVIVSWILILAIFHSLCFDRWPIGLNL